MVKYLHVRQLDEGNQLSPHGGVTVSYTCTLTEICMAIAMCNSADLFCYDIARRISAGRLQSPRYETIVIPLKHPITGTIVEYLEREICDAPISIWQDDHHRWVSDFQSENGVSVVDTDWSENLEFEPILTDQGVVVSTPPRFDDEGYHSERYDG